jgi:hypothetical protein
VRILSRFRRRGPRLQVTPSVPSLHELAKDAPALLVTNVGSEPAYHVVVSIRMRHTAFQFDEVPVVEPEKEAPLTHQSSVGRFKLEEMTVSAHWFRIALRSVVRDTGSVLRIPLSVRYKDREGTERARYQTLHCDEHLRLRVTD